MQLTALLLTYLLSTLASGQEPVRTRSISTPNRFDFSRIAADTESGVLLVAGVDFLIRVTPDFDQSTITNVNNLEGTVDYVGYNNNRFIVCFRMFKCEIYATDDINNSTATIESPLMLLSPVSPLSVEFGSLDSSEAVYIPASRVTGDSSTTRYSLFAFSLSTLEVVARFDGTPQSDISQRTLIMSFKHQTRIFFLYRYQEVGDTDPGVRLATLCNDGMRETNDVFASLIEVNVGPCVASYSYISSARVLTLQDGRVYLVLVYRESNDGIESRLCALDLDQLNTFIDDSFKTNSTGLLWASSFTGTSNTLSQNPAAVKNEFANACRLFAFTFYFALLMPESVPYSTIPVLPSAYSADPDSYGPVTSLHLTQLDSFYYMYIGTQSGVLIKYLVNSTSPTSTSPLLELEARQLSTTLRDRISELENNGDVLYALTPRELFRVPVEDCGRHATCGECVSDRDPICGWCGVQNACTKMSQCTNYNLTNRWIREDDTVCFSISSLAPNTANIGQMTNITISSLNLPQLSANERYECAFQTDTNGTSLIPITAVNGNSSLIRGPVTGTAGILCSIPSQTGLFTQTDNLLFNISLRVNTFTNSMDRVLNNNFTLYHCGFNRNCTACIVSDSPCGWCLFNTRCVPQVQQCVMQEWVQPSGSDSMCPRIDGNRFELPAEVNRDISLNASNLPQETLVYNYTCIISGTNLRVAGRLVNASSSLVCPLPGSALTAGFTGTVRVVWGPGDFEIEQGQIEVETFQCRAMTNCHTCLQNPQCAWCADAMNRTGSCAGQCLGGQNVFTPPGMMCPPPEIISFTPTSTAPGGVIAPLSVFGFNLAVPEQLPLVMLSGLECLIRSGYTTVRIECDLTVPSTPGDRTLTINVTAVRESGVGSQDFSVQDPTITAVFPGYAPEFGGTEVRVNGTNLLVGLTRRLTFGTQTCDITDSATVGTVDILTCETTRASEGQPLMSISIDSGVQRTYTTQPFDVLPNPVVQNMRLAGFPRELRGTIVSGALDYSLRGDNLGATLVQTLIFSLDGVELSRTVCEPPTEIDAEDLFCAGNPFTLATQITTGINIQFELVMDRVPDVTDPYFIPFTFTLYPDPVFTTGTRNHTISVLTGSDTISIPIPGLSNLPEEIISFRETRTGQDNFCSNTEITDTEIVCTINGTTPQSGLTVEIKIGENSNAYTLTLEVSFTEKNAAAQFLEDNLTLLIAVGVLVVLACCAIAGLLCLCWVCVARARRGSRKRREEAEHLLSEVEDIENDLADKCRKGFTDLNTQMGLDEGTLQVSTIPMLDLRTFAMRILFPGLQEHPVLHPVEGPRNVEAEVFNAGLHKFDSLLREKEFVRVMVHSMEDNRNFSTRDRCNVASLLTTALYNSMPYLTELLLDLLEELINKNITRNTAKLLLRRTESVAEKLLANWLAFNMYANLQGPVSVSMYKLYLGIKGHLEAGPVDVLSGAAVNSLSEEKLLRTEIEHKKLQVEVDTVEGERVSCCVLDCDTITQTKIKLMDQEYKGIGFSHRPKLEVGIGSSDVLNLNSVVWSHSYRLIQPNLNNSAIIHCLDKSISRTQNLPSYK